jgi:DNA-binding MarR family transcriptional regulator
VNVQREFTTAQEAANDPRILVFGRLLGAANRLEYLLGRSLELETGISHSLFELLLLAGRAGEAGIPVRDIAQARVLTSGGATRLVQRASAQGLIESRGSANDRRVQLIHLTSRGEQILLEAAALHARNIERFVIDPLPVDQAEVFAEAIRTLSKNAAKELPIMP